jgi:hypothetical protein
MVLIPVTGKTVGRAAIDPAINQFLAAGAVVMLAFDTLETAHAYERISPTNAGPGRVQ